MDNSQFAAAAKFNIQVLKREGDALNLHHLCSFHELIRAYGEMVFVLGGLMKYELAKLPAPKPDQGRWRALAPLMDPYSSAELLWSVCSTDQDELLQHMCRPVCWPEYGLDLNGMQRAGKAMGELGDLIARPWSTPVVFANTNSYGSLQKRIQEGMRIMKLLGYTARSERLITEFCTLAYASSVFLVVSAPA